MADWIKFVWGIVIIGVIGLVTFAFWNAYMILFRCPNRGDIIRFINWQNEVSSKWVNRVVWLLVALVFVALFGSRI